MMLAALLVAGVRAQGTKVADITLTVDISVLFSGGGGGGGGSWGGMSANAVPVVTAGTTSPLLALAANIAAPAGVNALSMVMTSPSQVGYTWTSTTADPAVLEAPTLNVPATGGVVSAAGTPMDLAIQCVGTGEVAFGITFAFTSGAGATSELDIKLKKTCAAGAGAQAAAALPAACATPEAMAKHFSDWKASGAATAPTTTPPATLTVATYNTHGIFGLSTALGAAIAASLARADVVLLQELFYASTRDAMAAALAQPHALKDGLGGGDSSQKTSSGLMLASRWPIVGCAFHEFAAASGLDASAAKGVAGALFHLGGGRLVYAFSTHLQAGGWGDGGAAAGVRDAQMRELRAFVARSLGDAAAAGWDRRRIAVAVGGDFNTLAAHDARTGVAVAPAHMLRALGAGAVDLTATVPSARDVVEGALPNVTGVTHWSNFTAPGAPALCALGVGAALAPPRPACPAANDTGLVGGRLISGVDFLLTLEQNGTADVRATSVAKPALCCTAEGNQALSMSDHVSVLARVDVAWGGAALEETVCCQAIELSCEACKKGMTPDAYCTKHTDAQVCKKKGSGGSTTTVAVVIVLVVGVVAGAVGWWKRNATNARFAGPGGGAAVDDKDDAAAVKIEMSENPMQQQEGGGGGKTSDAIAVT